MPVTEWPDEDRRIWRHELLPSDPFRDGGSRASHSKFSNIWVAAGYGKWLGWLAWQGALDPSTSPGERITRPLVKAYMVDLAKHNATATILARLVALKIMARLMDPTRDWSWIDRGISFVKARHRPARPKLHRIVDAEALFDFGRREMDRLMVNPARLHDFSKFRDHLMIAMLACVPLRPRNLAELILYHTFVRRGNLWWLQIPAADTKTKNDAIELPLPQELVTYIDHYLAAYREPLIRTTGARTAPGAVWLLKNGARMSPAKMSRPIAARIEKALGRRVTPHLFRDCVATSVADRDPAHIGIAVKLLGHRAPETLERHYNQAGHIEANRLVQECLLSLGKGIKAV